MRIVSLLPSATEIIARLGAGASLVGRSHECDFPPGAADLPTCTAPKFEPDGTSYRIDERVKALLQEGISVYRVNAARLAELAPDVIVTQAHCEVCAVSLSDVEAAVCELLPSNPLIVALQPESLESVMDDIGRVAAAIDRVTDGEQLVATMREQMASIAAAVAGQPRPRVATIEWLDPLMAGGNWMPELVEMAGGDNLFGKAGAHSPWMEWDAIVAADPDVLVLVPCGFDIARTRTELDLLTARPGWADLAAVRNGRVALADGNQYFNRPGPRLVESLAILAEVCHPDVIPPRHHGSGWEPLPASA